MYKLLYKLESRPFEPQPDPSFLWLGGKHKEALSVLRDGMLDNLGFVLLTGAEGTGKTVLVNGLTRGLKGDVVWAVISEPNLDRIDFYNKIGTGFGIEKQFISKVQFLIQFSHFLHKTHDAGKKVVLFVDDCHLLSQDILEELYLLSNIEKADAKLIDIFLVGQPEFNEMLDQPKNKVVRQRLGLKARLAPLGRNETVDYISHRLKISGNSERIFTARAFQTIHQYSQGVPRFINLICEKALQTGSSQGEKNIDHKLILECVQKLKLPVQLDSSDLKPPAVEEKQVEDGKDKFVSVDIGTQTATAGLIAGKGKKRIWLFSALSLLVCIGMGLYFLSPKKELPIAVEIDSTTAVQDPEVASVPAAVALIRERNTENNNTENSNTEDSRTEDSYTEDSHTVVHVQEDTGPEGLVLEKISQEKVSGKEQDAVETAQLETGETETGQIFKDVQREEKVLETEGPVVEPVVSAVVPEPTVTPVLPPLEPGKVILGLQPGSVRLTADADRIFTEFIETLLQYPDAKILVKGFVSSNNDSPENTQLSKERAASIRELLVKHGVAEAHIEIRGMGIQDPIATNDTWAGRQKNRRVEIEVIGDDV